MYYNMLSHFMLHYAVLYILFCNVPSYSHNATSGVDNISMCTDYILALHLLIRCRMHDISRQIRLHCSRQNIVVLKVVSAVLPPAMRRGLLLHHRRDRRHLATTE